MKKKYFLSIFIFSLFIYLLNFQSCKLSASSNTGSDNRKVIKFLLAVDKKEMRDHPMKTKFDWHVQPGAGEIMCAGCSEPSSHIYWCKTKKYIYLCLSRRERITK